MISETGFRSSVTRTLGGCRVIVLACVLHLALSTTVDAQSPPATVPASHGDKQVALSEARLRKTIEAIRKNAPDYEEMVPALGEAVKSQLSSIRGKVVPLGAIKSLKYVGVHQSMNVFEVAFEKGALVWAIGVTAAGKTEALYFE